MARHPATKRPAKRSARGKSSPALVRRSAPDGATTKLKALVVERDELVAQQTAMADVLKIISATSGGLDYVFQAILANATRLCEAKFANLVLFEDGAVRRVALYGAPRGWVNLTRR